MPGFAGAHTALGDVLVRMGKHLEGLNEKKLGCGVISFHFTEGFSVQQGI